MQDFDYRIDRKRGCGWRKPGGLYLVTSGLSAPCGKLPIALDVCPTCSAGIKFSRGWTWIDPRPLAGHPDDCPSAPGLCTHCPLGGAIPERAGLIWIGQQFYATPLDWEREAQQAGVCRRIRSVPRDFVLGETWVFVAHLKVMHCCDGHCSPGIFHAFRPDAIEYVMHGDESAHELEQLHKRRITPVLVEHAEPQQHELFT